VVDQLFSLQFPSFIHYLCENIFAMTTIIINERSKGAKKLIEYLKTQPFIKIVEEKTPSPTLAKSIKEAKSGKTTEYKNTEELFLKLRKKANV
jgi:hypothetical protein